MGLHAPHQLRLDGGVVEDVDRFALGEAILLLYLQVVDAVDEATKVEVLTPLIVLLHDLVALIDGLLHRDLDECIADGQAILHHPDHAASHVRPLHPNRHHQLRVVFLQQIVHHDHRLGGLDVAPRNIDLIVADLLNEVLEGGLLEVVRQHGLQEEFHG